MANRPPAIAGVLKGSVPPVATKLSITDFPMVNHLPEIIEK
jgi:hypothetical protein